MKLIKPTVKHWVEDDKYCYKFPIPKEDGDYEFMERSKLNPLRYILGKHYLLCRGLIEG